MGLILDNNVEETKIMSAYGLTVYGKINRSVWTISDRKNVVIKYYQKLEK